MADELLGTMLHRAVFPALALLPPSMGSPEAWHMLLAAGLQESGLCERCQVLPDGGRGPAHGLWQHELGGVRAVLSNQVTSDHAAVLCAERGVAAEAQAVWKALEVDDVLAAGFARLLLWAAPKPLPNAGRHTDGWALYLDAWRPGKPRPQDWPANWARVQTFIYGG